MGSCKVMVLHDVDTVMTDSGAMARELKEHSRRVAQGGLHEWKVVSEYLRGSPKARNWRKLPELVLPMTVVVMREAMKHSTAGDCSPGMDGIGVPLCHVLAGSRRSP